MNLSAGEYEVDATKFMNHVNEVPIIHDEDRPAPNVDMLSEIVMYSGGVCQLDGKKKKKGSSAPNTQEMIKING